MFKSKTQKLAEKIQSEAYESLMPFYGDVARISEGIIDAEEDNILIQKIACLTLGTLHILRGQGKIKTE